MTSSTAVSPKTNASDPWLSNAVRIRHVKVETPGVATYGLVFCNPNVGREFRYRPGQFNMLYVPGVGESAISISGDPADRGSLEHTIRVAGNVTKSLAALPAGSTIGLRGPFGSHWPIEHCQGRDVILVAGGIGLAPLRPVIHELLAQRELYRHLFLQIGARDPAGLLYASQFADWRLRGLDVQVTVDRGTDDWSGHVGMVTTLLDRIPLSDPANTVLMTCGPEVMMWYTVQTAIRRGLNPDRVYVSLERNMNCAIGLCGHCQFGPQFLCKDGPVFPYHRVASILKVGDL